ncbi:LOW QUALITY PROTEIN: Hypothetical protein PHPALM_6938 [Phytophthora palmivora]|uniref:Uncharacterized protein n=1 Tax=Phytophthora palmivora TaxID=4796 RepID=A0A2P4YDL9_9STRA|nr:LOW QUALITY PROTEIN: Hypothetical protein PHPALM_6938 [Phytophthora palmivora]
MAGDVASAFRNISIHNNSVYLFAGRIEEENVLVNKLSAPFCWPGSPACYEAVGGAISHRLPLQGYQPNQRTLRFAIKAILGAEAFNDEKFTQGKTRQRVRGLEFDSVAELVSIPQTKVDKARGIIASAYSAEFLMRKTYRSLMGSLRHVAACLRAARSFLQFLRHVSGEMKQDLLWWLHPHTPQLNGVSLEFFNVLPPPDIVKETHRILSYALDTAAHRALTYQFSKVEIDLTNKFKADYPNGFDINFRELLSCAFAVHTEIRELKFSSAYFAGGRPRIDFDFQRPTWQELAMAMLTPAPAYLLTRLLRLCLRY